MVETAVWWLFIEFFAHLPVILYPILTFLLTGAGVVFFGNYVPGVHIQGIVPGIVITLVLTVVNAIMGSILVLDEDEAFDRNVTRPMVQKYGKPTKTDVPGFLFWKLTG